MKHFYYPNFITSYYSCFLSQHCHSNSEKSENQKVFLFETWIHIAHHMDVSLLNSVTVTFLIKCLTIFSHSANSSSPRALSTEKLDYIPCRGIGDSQNRCSGYNIKLHPVVRLQCWSFVEQESTSSLTSLPCPFWPRAAVQFNIQSWLNRPVCVREVFTCWWNSNICRK